MPRHVRVELVTESDLFFVYHSNIDAQVGVVCSFDVLSLVVVQNDAVNSETYG